MHVYVVNDDQTKYTRRGTIRNEWETVNIAMQYYVWVCVSIERCIDRWKQVGHLKLWNEENEREMPYPSIFVYLLLRPYTQRMWSQATGNTMAHTIQASSLNLWQFNVNCKLWNIPFVYVLACSLHSVGIVFLFVLWPTWFVLNRIRCHNFFFFAHCVGWRWRWQRFRIQPISIRCIHELTTCFWSPSLCLPVYIGTTKYVIWNCVVTLI